jgi:hypothetical protein
LEHHPPKEEPTMTEKITTGSLTRQLKATHRLQTTQTTLQTIQTILLALLLVITIPTAIISTTLLIIYIQATEKMNQAAEQFKQQQQLKQQLKK